MIGFALLYQATLTTPSEVTVPQVRIRLFGTRRLREQAFADWGRVSGWEERDIPIEDAA